MNRLFFALLAILAVAYIVLQYQDHHFYAIGVKSLFLIVLTVLYFLTVKDKRFFVTLFLVTFAIGETTYFSTWYMEDESWNTFYFLTNLLYILAYAFLIASIIRQIDIGKMIKSYPLQIVILLAMSVFCVFYISYSAEYHLATFEFLLEVFYNAVLMTLLSIALLNYVIKQDSKSMTFLIATILIVFSEMLQYANNYVAEFALLRLISSTFTVLAFGLYYMQSKLAPETEIDYLLESENANIELKKTVRTKLK